LILSSKLSDVSSKLQKVLTLRGRTLRIGEAGEFDYSERKLLKAPKEEDVFGILINPNTTTIQISEDLADRVCLLPVDADFIVRIIEKERPDERCQEPTKPLPFRCNLAPRGRSKAETHSASFMFIVFANRAQVFAASCNRHDELSCFKKWSPYNSPPA
jgi:hypothetical protein